MKCVFKAIVKYHEIEEDLIGMIKKLMNPDPDSRISAADALEDHFFDNERTHST